MTLQPGQTYVVSVGLNAFYAKTMGGLGTQRTSGPLQSVADGQNGIYANAAGQFPTNSWGSSNYFVDAVVKLPGEPPRTPQVSSTLPLSNATGVPTDWTVRATFSLDLDPTSVTTSSFTLRDEDDNLVPATVSYDEDTRTATLTPTAALDTGVSYLARLATTIRSDDGTVMGAPYAWSFATVPPGPPSVIATSPATGAVNVSPVGAVTATFSEPMNGATLQAGGLVLSGPGGAVPATVTYDNPTRTARLIPSAPLAASTAYTAQVTTLARSAKGIAVAAPVSWSFTTSACACRLYGDGNPGVDFTGISTRNGRDPAFQWSLELGVKVRVDEPARLEAIRFWKDADETGTHSGRLWTAGGTLLATATFSGETGSGLADGDARYAGRPGAGPDLRRVRRHQRVLQPDALRAGVADRLRPAADGRRRPERRLRRRGRRLPVAVLRVELVLRRPGGEMRPKTGLLGSVRPARSGLRSIG